MRNVIYRFLAGAIGLFLVIGAFVPPGPADSWFFFVVLTSGGILLFFAATGKNPVLRRTWDRD